MPKRTVDEAFPFHPVDSTPRQTSTHRLGDALPFHPVCLGFFGSNWPGWEGGVYTVCQKPYKQDSQAMKEMKEKKANHVQAEELELRKMFESTGQNGSIKVTSNDPHTPVTSPRAASHPTSHTQGTPPPTEPQSTKCPDRPTKPTC
jgi:hypothetical protein